ncbi:MAG: sterol desaturase family protein [Caulobacteraceae bacterium]|nr:sterol desaturase family protein [Caulobacteraceae bacterium]
MPPRAASPLPGLQTVLAHLLQALQTLFLGPASGLSFESLACALAIAAAVLIVRRRRRGRRVRARVLLRALLPRRLLTSASGKADVGLACFNVFLAGALFAGALVSAHQVAVATQGGLKAVLGAAQPAPLPRWLGSGLMTLGLFLAFELAYWVNHAMSHKIPFLWEFHRVHHTAEQLSPLTNFRVHPVDSLLYLNTSALFTGVVGGALKYALGRAVAQVSIAGDNLFLFLALFLLIHLQHSHVWIAARGVLGRIVLSPAHHQLHHSTNPAHFNKNFGGCLSLWDWLFGTLLIPSRERERLSFGVEAKGERPHSLVGVAVTPFVRAWASLRPAPAAAQVPPGEEAVA